jgi:hypothetical protein
MWEEDGQVHEVSDHIPLPLLFTKGYSPTQEVEARSNKNEPPVKGLEERGSFDGSVLHQTLHVE